MTPKNTKTQLGGNAGNVLLAAEYQEYLRVIEESDSPIVRGGALTYDEWLECRDELKGMNKLFCGKKGVQ